jgi:hypothetical protein
MGGAQAMTKEVNILFIHGWGPDALFGQALETLRRNTIAEFDDTIFAPPALDYQEAAKMMAYLARWKDDTIMVALSCGCGRVNMLAKDMPAERIPFAMYCSPSIPCGMNPVQKLGAVPVNIERALQVTPSSDWFFNPFRQNLIYAAPGNTTSKIEFMQSDRGHGTTPLYGPAQDRFFAEIKRAQQS